MATERSGEENMNKSKEQIMKDAKNAGSASTTQSPYMGQLLKTGLFSLFSAHLVPFATFH